MKPTYEQLEQKLAAVISERDAAVSAERIWEKSMMEACGEDGPASVAAEIAALRAQRDTALESLRKQLAAVVAENAGLKSAIDATIGWQQSTDPENVESVRMLVDIKTPATDASMAEVRAQGVEMFSEKFGGGTPLSSMVKEVAAEFATQLRQGAK